MATPASPGRIGVVGSSMVDLVTAVSRMPDGGETLEALSFTQGGGGKGANQAVAAARLGAPVSLVAAVGDDVFGTATLEALAREGIDAAHVRRVPGTPNGVATILVSPDGENRILIVKGANAALGRADVDAAMDTIRGCALLLLQLEIPLDTVTYAIERAHEAGVPVLLNPAPASAALAIEQIRSVRFFAPNQTELAILTGLPTATRADAAAAAATLVAAGIGAVIVTLGGDGALLVTADAAPLHVPAVPVAPVDTTGAGDAFIGAFAYHHASLGLPVADALGRAAAYAAHSVTGPGTQSSFADAAAFERFLAER